MFKVNRTRLQFGLGSIFVLTTVVAVAVTVLPSIPPEYPVFFAYVCVVVVAWLLAVLVIAYLLSKTVQHTARFIEWLLGLERGRRRREE